MRIDLFSVILDFFKGKQMADIVQYSVETASENNYIVGQTETVCVRRYRIRSRYNSSLIGEVFVISFRQIRSIALSH